MEAVANKIKIKLKCKSCGEKFTLRGTFDGKKFETGFKQCVCGEDKDFDLEIIE